MEAPRKAYAYAGAEISRPAAVESAPGRAMPLTSTSAVPPRSCRTSEKISIVIADDHPIFRDGLRKLLETQPDFDVVGEAVNGAEAVQLVREFVPHVLLLDLSMPHLDGLEVLDELGRIDVAMKTQVKIILLVAGIDKAQRIKSLQLGACGIVLKDTPTHLIMKSIRTVAAGGYWVERDSVSDLVEALAEMQAGRDHGPKNWGLTPRELEVLGLVVSGYSNKDIAQTFSVSEHTVKHHLTNIFNKTGVSNRLELALFAIHHQVVRPPCRS